MTELHTAAVVPCTESEGPYARWAVWTRGCTIRCLGCCNPELFDAGLGVPTSIEALLEDLRSARTHHPIEGITILGGEPLDQLEGVTTLADAAARQGLGVIVFSGYTLAEAARMRRFGALWSVVDTFVDGRFDPRLPDFHRRFVGSTNQRLHHRTRRYREDALWTGPAGVEARIAPDGTFSLHGDPPEVRGLLRALTKR
jgi:anaerobic ribonucleoside-triphosphate reductase activating protein